MRGFNTVEFTLSIKNFTLVKALGFHDIHAFLYHSMVSFRCGFGLRVIFCTFEDKEEQNNGNHDYDDDDRLGY